jgi:hypothetical protein
MHDEEIKSAVEWERESMGGITSTASSQSAFKEKGSSSNSSSMQREDEFAFENSRKDFDP